MSPELNLESLLGAADGNLDWLLSRLRMLVREERVFTNDLDPPAYVQQLYWIRQ